MDADQRLRTLGVGIVAAGLIYSTVVRRWLRNWGASDEERMEALPGDEIVPEPKYVTTHAISINAPADRVWPWVVQIGQGRGGFYSYDWIENLIGLGIHSIDRIDPELQAINVGDTISLAPDNGLPMEVVTLEPNKALVLSTGKLNEPPRPGDYLKNELAGSWAFVLQPTDSDSTRFLVRFRSDWQPSVVATALNTVMLEPAHCIMERKMMLGIKERAERRAF